MSLKGYKKSRLGKSLARVLVFMLVIQGMPFQQLSQSYLQSLEQNQSALRWLTEPLILAETQAALSCDIDTDGDVDRDDINAIFSARGTAASPGDPRDVNGDGVITINDGRLCVLQCTLPRCAIVTGANTPPVADAGPNQNVDVDAQVTLDGSASTDPDNGPNLLTFSWTFVSVAPGSALTDGDIVDADTAAPMFTPDVEGSYVLNLEVSDGQDIDSAQVTITAAVLNVPPNANAGPNQNVEVGAQVTLDGSASTDPDNGPNLLTFSWTFVSVAPGSALTDGDIVDADTAAPMFTPDVAGDYVVNLEVSDGQDIDSDQVTITAAVLNVPPNANAGPNQNVEVGTKVTLDVAENSLNMQPSRYIRFPISDIKKKYWTSISPSDIGQRSINQRGRSIKIYS